ncbi:MAG TPA: DLW-39 family protein [Jatrophihabitans sp.]
MKPVIAVIGLVGVAVAVMRRRQAHADQALWREATSDSSR